MSVVRAVLIGAGNRGRYVYGRYAQHHPDQLRIVAAAEPLAERRAHIAADHGLGPGALFEDWRALLAARPDADAAIVATSDQDHVGPALGALEAGYALLLEKPIAPDPVDCARIVAAAEARGQILQICHVLRYSRFYESVHEVLASGVLGDIELIDMREHVGYWHFTHSYVRGRFRNTSLAAPLILAKTCHDLDLLAWFAGRPPLQLSSFGSLDHFRAERAPDGAPERCADGCPVQADCPHDAVRLYLGPDDETARGWPWSDVSREPARAAREAALASGPYGRCVYRCDNDVADHQVVTVEFEGGIVATLGVHGHASRETRTLRISGSRGELRGHLHDGRIEVSTHGRAELETREIPGHAWGHYGGDVGLLEHFCRVVRERAPEAVRASGRVALDSHLMGFAAERARRDACVVSLRAFREEVNKAARTR